MTTTPNWQPLAMLPMFANMIDASLDDAKAMLANVQEGRTKPHILDDATVDRIDRADTQVLAMADIYRQQLVRWREEAEDPEDRAEVERLVAVLPDLDTMARAILAGAQAIWDGTIDRILEMDDAELGLAALTGQGFPGQR